MTTSGSTHQPRNMTTFGCAGNNNIVLASALNASIRDLSDFFPSPLNIFLIATGVRRYSPLFQGDRGEREKRGDRVRENEEKE